VADRIRYLVAYDIRHPRRLRRVHRVAKDHGEPLQYSVFVCDFTPVELIALKRTLLAEIKMIEDGIGIFDLGAPARRGVQCVDSSASAATFPMTIQEPSLRE
jgi:CRISPR-associated protein Cas2